MLCRNKSREGLLYAFIRIIHLRSINQSLMCFYTFILLSRKKKLPVLGLTSSASSSVLCSSIGVTFWKQTLTLFLHECFRVRAKYIETRALMIVCVMSVSNFDSVYWGALLTSSVPRNVFDECLLYPRCALRCHLLLFLLAHFHCNLNGSINWHRSEKEKYVSPVVAGRSRTLHN